MAGSKRLRFEILVNTKEGPYIAEGTMGGDHGWSGEGGGGGGGGPSVATWTQQKKCANHILILV